MKADCVEWTVGAGRRLHAPARIYVRAFGFVVLAALGGKCTARQPSQPQWSFDDHAGIVSIRSGVACFVTKAKALSGNTALVVVDLSLQRQYQAAVVPANGLCVDAAPSGMSFQAYRIRFDGPAPVDPSYAVGIVGVTTQFHAVDGAMAADVDGDRRNEIFRSCTSAEGVHFTSWSDAAISGQRRWHQYQYLGYDVTPTCTPAESEER